MVYGWTSLNEQWSEVVNKHMIIYGCEMGSFMRGEWPFTTREWATYGRGVYHLLATDWWIGILRARNRLCG